MAEILPNTIELGLLARGFEYDESRSGYRFKCYVRKTGIPAIYWVRQVEPNAGRLFTGNRRPPNDGCVELTGTPLYQAILQDGLRRLSARASGLEGGENDD